MSSNLKKSKPKKRNIRDGFENVLSNLGTRKDKKMASVYGVNRLLSQWELETIYQNQWVSKAIDGKPFDMVREWREFESNDLKPEQLAQLKAEEVRLELRSTVKQALTWAGLYGGAAIVLTVDGHGDLSQPLDVTKIKAGQLRKVTAVDRWIIQPIGEVNYNPLSEFFGQAEYYQLAWDTAANHIHRSRIIRFIGRDMPIHIKQQQNFWGDSLIQRWYQSMLDYDTVVSGTTTLVHEANIDTLKVAGLTDALTQDKGEEDILSMLEVQSISKSIVNAMVIDAEDDLVRNPVSFSSLPEIEKFKLQTLAGATDYPLRRLLGEASAGFGAVDDSSTRDYYDTIRSLQNNDLSPRLMAIDEVLVRSVLGTYPEDLTFKYNSLWQVSEKEQAETNAIKLDNLLKLQEIGVPESVLMRDAVEQGLVQNLDESDIEEYEREIEPVAENQEEFPEVD